MQTALLNYFVLYSLYLKLCRSFLVAFVHLKSKTGNSRILTLWTLATIVVSFSYWSLAILNGGRLTVLTPASSFLQIRFCGLRPTHGHWGPLAADNQPEQLLSELPTRSISSSSSRRRKWPTLHTWPART